jgi:regulator of protease activity HflC (stomatin/prohibitin superfamily)
MALNKSMTQDEAMAVFKKVKRTLMIAGGLLTAFILVNASYSTVGPGQRGIMVTMGKTGTEVLGEGPHMKVPFFSEVRTMSIRVKKSQDTTEAATKDMQKVQAVVALNWTINPDSVGKMLREVGDESAIDNNIIAPAVSEVLKAATAKMTAEEVLSKRIELKENIDKALIARLTAYGLIIKDISLVDLDFTREFNHAVEQKQIAEQEAKQAEYVALKATQDAKARVNAAKGQAEANVALAKADAESNLLKARAQSEAQKMLQASTTKEVLQLKYYERWNGVLPQVMTGNGGGIMMQIPANAQSSQPTTQDSQGSQQGSDQSSDSEK